MQMLTFSSNTLQ